MDSVDKVNTKFGNLNILVNNAATKTEKWDKFFARSEILKRDPEIQISVIHSF